MQLQCFRSENASVYVIIYVLCVDFLSFLCYIFDLYLINNEKLVIVCVGVYVYVCRLVEQLRCALKAKNVIIDQLELERSDSARQFEIKIAELRDKISSLETMAALNVS